MASEKPLTPEQTARKQEDRDEVARKVAVWARGLFTVLGIALLLLGTIGWLNAAAPGTSSVTKASTTEVTAPAAADQAGGTTTTAVQSVDKTAPGSWSAGSESVVATLVGLGVLLLLCAAFFGRVTKVMLPGGAGFELGPETQVQIAKLATATAQTEEGLSPTPETVALLYRQALLELAARQPAVAYPRRMGWPSGTPSWGAPTGSSGWGGTSPGDDLIEEAVSAAAKTVQTHKEAAGASARKPPP
jgi:hypothetical protein